MSNIEITSPTAGPWAPFVLFGGLTIISGNHGCGRTSLAATIAASVSRGVKLATLPTTRASIELLDGEETLAEAYLVADGSPNMMRLSTIDNGTTLDDVLHLIRVLPESPKRLVVIDPSESVRADWNDIESLRSLAEVSRETGHALVVVVHHRKAGDPQGALRSPKEIAHTVLFVTAVGGGWSILMDRASGLQLRFQVTGRGQITFHSDDPSGQTPS